MSLAVLKILVLLGMIALPIGLYLWARRRRPASVAGADVAANAPVVPGVVEHALRDDRWGVRLVDGTWVNAIRAHAMWRQGIVVKAGDRVAVRVTPGQGTGTIVARS